MLKDDDQVVRNHRAYVAKAKLQNPSGNNVDSDGTPANHRASSYWRPLALTPRAAPSSVPRRPVLLRFAGARGTYYRGASTIAPNTTNASSNPNWTTASKSR